MRRRVKDLLRDYLFPTPSPSPRRRTIDTDLSIVQGMDRVTCARPPGNAATVPQGLHERRRSRDDSEGYQVRFSNPPRRAVGATDPVSSSEPVRRSSPSGAKVSRTNLTLGGSKQGAFQASDLP